MSKITAIAFKTICIQILFAIFVQNAVAQTDIPMSKDSVEASCNNVASANRPYIVSSWVVSYGDMYLRDTYLSNLRYLGWNIGLDVLHTGFFRDRQGTTSIYWKNINAITYGNTINVPATAAITYYSGEFGFGVGYSRLLRQFDIRAGGYASLLLGMKNNSRNINNIVSADAALNLRLDVEVTYRLRFRKTALYLSDNIQLPLIGVMFVPEYGALYYKTSLNSMVDNLHFSSLHNRKGIHNRFEVSLAFSNVILKLQHYINYQYWTANDLYFSCLQHNVGFGLVLYLRNVTRDFR